MINWPENLVRDLARRSAVIVLGSGVSKHAASQQGRRPPVWKEFLLSALEQSPEGGTEHIAEAIKTGDLLHACEWLKKRSDENWTPFLRREFRDPIYIAGDLHSVIVELDARIVFSLNFDNIYENAANSTGENAYIVKHYYHEDVCEFLRGDGRYIVKLHGDLDSPQNLIFTQRDYSNARTKFSGFYSAFDAALLTNTFLFIGCGYQDPDINLLLENQAFGFPGNADSPHYFLTSIGVNADLIQSLRANRNLKTITYDPVDDLHSGLVNELRQLATAVEEKRSLLTETLNW